MKWILILAGLCLSQESFTQNRYFTKTGKISFFSDAPMEKIEAVNRSVSAVLDSKTGQLQFLVLMKGFEFRKALMQEHFNENYIESDKYPKAQFKGVIQNNAQINYTRPGNYEAIVKGTLSLHGQEKEMETKGTIIVQPGHLQAEAVFWIKLGDYQVSIPSLVKDKVSENVRITVTCLLDPL